MRIFALILLLTLNIRAQEACDDCAPLAEVGISNSGLEKIITMSLQQNLDKINQQIIEKSQFRDFKLDKSDCKPQTLSEVFTGKAKWCGLPELDPETGGVGADTKIRPFTGELNNLKLEKIKLALAKPVKCEKMVCDFDVKATDLEVSGNIKVAYTDAAKEDFIPTTKMTLKTTEKADVHYTGQALIDPKTGQINDLVYLNDKKSKIDLSPGSLELKMDINNKFPSHEKEVELKAKNFHRFVKTKTFDDRFIETQYSYTFGTLSSSLRDDLLAERKAKGLPDPTEKEMEAINKKADADATALINKKYGSAAGMKQKMKSVKWPDPTDANATYEFMKNPPEEVLLMPDVAGNIDFATVAAVGENSGFKNPYAFALTAAGTQFANNMAATDSVNKEFLQPVVNEQVLPKVQEQVNLQLRDIRKYWDQIAKIPNLNARNLQVMQDLKIKLAAAKTDTEKNQIQKDIDDLSEKMKKDWITIDTEVAVDQNTRDGQVLKALISKSNPACATYPKKFSDDSDHDFDIRTTLGTNALQEYFNRASTNNNLDFCVGATNPATCEGGSKVHIKRPPKISCVNGEYAMDVDAETAKSLLGVNYDVQVQGRIKAKISNCSGSPCLQFTDSSGRIKNAFLNTFFGQMVDHGIANALAQSQNLPVGTLPNTQLATSTTDRDCNTKLDWKFKETNPKP